MDIPDFSTLVLSKQQLEDLRLLSQKTVENTGDWTKRLDPLYKLGFVDYEMDISNGLGPKGKYKISKKGELYLQYLARRKSELRFSYALSVLALVVSVISLIVSIVH